MGRPAADALTVHLRMLKERSGRSFDALAGRVGVSKSALHRYCSGDAQPATFGVLERFATECGATRAEVLELHRHWVAAAGDPPRLPAERTATPAAQVSAATARVTASVVAGATRPAPSAPSAPSALSASSGSPLSPAPPARRARRELPPPAGWVFVVVGLLCAAAIFSLAAAWWTAPPPREGRGLPPGDPVVTRGMERDPGSL